MNKKNKLLLSATAMLVVTGAAATASTYAWFTTVRSATINYAQAEVYTKTGDLTVDYVGSLLTTVNPVPTNPQNLSITGTHRITDISGNGNAFYKPTWNAADVSSTTADSIETIAVAGTGAADGFYVDFTVAVSQSNDATGNMNVYLGAGTVITPHNGASDTQDVAAVKASRLAVLDENKQPLFIWAPEALDVKYEYLAANATGNTYGVDGFEEKTQTAAADAGDVFYAGAIATYTTSTIASNNNMPAIVTLLGTSDATPDYSDEITFRAWIEGTDPDCENTSAGKGALAGIFDITIDLYGLAA